MSSTKMMTMFGGRSAARRSELTSSKNPASRSGMCFIGNSCLKIRGRPIAVAQNSGQPNSQTHTKTLLRGALACVGGAGGIEEALKRRKVIVGHFADQQFRKL